MLFECSSLARQRRFLTQQYGSFTLTTIHRHLDALPDYITLVHAQLLRWERLHQDMSADEQGPLGAAESGESDEASDGEHGTDAAGMSDGDADHPENKDESTSGSAYGGGA